MHAWEVNEGVLTWSPVTDPAPATGESAVRVLAAGLCGSDVAKLTKPVIPTPPGRPWRPGHEILGSHAGRTVAVNPLVPCDECERCAEGAINVCPRLRMIGWYEPGAFASWVVAPEANVVDTPATMPELTGVLAEPTAVAVHGVRCGLGSATGRLGIVGGGTLAIASAAYAASRGWSVDLLVRDPARVRERTGPLAATIRPLSAVEGRTYDAVIDAASGTDDTSFVAALDAVRDGGTIVVQTAYYPGVQLSRDLREPIRRGLTIAGSFSFCRRGGTDDFAEALAFLGRDHEWTLPLLTHRYPLADLEQALVDVRQPADKRPGKVVLIPA